GVTRFLEIGPDSTLTALTQNCLDDSSGSACVPVLRKDGGEARHLAAAIARLHLHGAVLAWSDILPGARTVALPTYAFRRDRYWLDRSYAQNGSALSEAVAGGLHHEVVWRTLTGLPHATRLPGRWLLVRPSTLAGDDAGDSDLTAALRDAGADLITVQQHRHDTRAELGSRIAAAVADGPLTGVVSLLALSAGESGEPEEVPEGVLGTATLIQALGDVAIQAPVWALTRGAVAVAANDPAPDPDQAAVWGLGRVAALEHPDCWGGLLDLPTSLDRRSAARVVTLLSGAESGSDTREDQVAVRSGAVLARRLVPAPPVTGTDPDTGTNSGIDTDWRPSGTVLVTGGTGALGAQVARWAAEQGAEHLLLVSRRGAEAPGAAELRDELASLGATTTFVSVDLTSRDAVREVLDSHEVNAVVHTAGVLDDGVLDGLDAEQFGTVFRAKVTGARHLDELTRDRHLDAFVLFSSFAGTVGSAGQANYAAANAVLDALAERRRAE
ncbi:beta-ketoacyl reductase, partial [Streptomyces sparsus]